MTRPPNSRNRADTLLDGDKKTDQFSRFIPDADAHKVRVEVPAPDGGQPAIFEGSMPAK